MERLSNIKRFYYEEGTLSWKEAYYAILRLAERKVINDETARIEAREIFVDAMKRDQEYSDSFELSLAN